MLRYNKATGETQPLAATSRPTSIQPNKPFPPVYFVDQLSHGQDVLQKALLRVLSYFEPRGLGVLDEVLFEMLLQSRILGLRLTPSQVDNVFGQLAPPDEVTLIRRVLSLLGWQC